MEELDLQSLLLIVRRRWWVVVSLTLVAVIVSSIVSFFILQLVYESDTTLYVGRNLDSQNTITSSDITLNTQLVNDYRELVKSRLISKIVIDELNLTNMTPNSLSKILSVNSVSNTRFIQISARHTDPQMAMLITQKVAEVFKVKVIEIMKVENVQTIDTAELPLSPVKPNKRMNIAIAGLVGIMLGLGVAFLIEYLDNTIKTPDDVLKHTGISVIGTIPVDTNMLSAHSMPKSLVSEAYRGLRTNIQFFSVDKILKTLVVTSSGPSEGKSTTISNLAVTCTQSGLRVLVVDGDLRKPRVHRMFGLTNKAGLTNVLALHEDYSLYICNTEIENLDILSSGPIPPNPSELLSSNSMKQFLDKVQQDYDLVFIDAPPIGLVTDAAILSTVVDGTILIAASGQVNISELQQAQELLVKVKANIIGVVVNKMDKYTGSSCYNYDEYYEEESKTNYFTKTIS